MTNLEALLKAVLANPDDDTPRLVYADALQEDGQAERAEFIRNSIANPDGMWWFRELWDVGHALRNGLEHYLDDLAWPGPNTFNPSTPGLVWHRGFVEQIRCPAAAWIACADSILAEHPIRKATLISRSPVLTGDLDMRGGKPHVLIAGKWIDYSHLGGYPELDKIVLHTRWPSIPVEGWELPQTMSGCMSGCSRGE
jgi:uncharacterized protein (TIGR02996 family)